MIARVRTHEACNLHFARRCKEAEKAKDGGVVHNLKEEPGLVVAVIKDSEVACAKARHDARNISRQATKHFQHLCSLKQMA